MNVLKKLGPIPGTIEAQTEVRVFAVNFMFHGMAVTNRG